MAPHFNKTRLYRSASLRLLANSLSAQTVACGAIEGHCHTRRQRFEFRRRASNPAALLKQNSSSDPEKQAYNLSNFQTISYRKKTVTAKLKDLIAMAANFPWFLRASVSNRSLAVCFKTLQCTALCMTVAIAGKSCSAQQLEPAPDSHTASPQLHEQTALALVKPEPFSSSATPAFASEAELYIAARPVQNPRIADKKYFLMNALHLGTAVLDVELTQRCIASHQCREGNPLMPSSQAGQLSVSIGYVALGAFTSYRLKKHKLPYWWLPPAGGIAGHAAGIATGLSH
jgi:hypothetical protein